MTSVLTLSPYLLPLLLLVAALVAGLAWRVLSRRASREAPPAHLAPARVSRRAAPAPGQTDESLPGTDEGPEVDEVTPSGWPLTLVAPQDAPAEAAPASPKAPAVPSATPMPTVMPAPTRAAEPAPGPTPPRAPAREPAREPLAAVQPPAPQPAPAAWPQPPLAPSVPVAAADALPPQSAASAPRRAALPILLVDDSPTVRAALRRCLRAGGHDVLQAGNGQEALSVLHRQRCGLLITDLEMPVMDGVGLLRQLQAAGLLEDLPVLAISGHEHASRSLPPDLPIDGVFRKPWSDAELLQRVAELTAQPRDTALRA